MPLTGLLGSWPVAGVSPWKYQSIYNVKRIHEAAMVTVVQVPAAVLPKRYLRISTNGRLPCMFPRNASKARAEKLCDVYVWGLNFKPAYQWVITQFTSYQK